MSGTTSTIPGGVTSSGLTVSSGETLTVDSGGEIVSATVESGGSVIVVSGGVQSATTILSGGTETVSKNCLPNVRTGCLEHLHNMHHGPTGFGWVAIGDT